MSCPVELALLLISCWEPFVKVSNNVANAALASQDDTELLPNVTYNGPWPKVPKDADLVLLRRSTIFEASPVCKQTPVLKADWGFGMVGYLVSRAGAKRMIQEAERAGFAGPIDGHIWYHNKVYVMGEDWATHPPCANPCPTSIRTYLNGEITEEPD
eukprot:m.89390 g.89390  ORF g.89390 m.89390 type:complete len:157 (+) comp14576_c1_seq1:105-575(+)